MLLRTKTCKLLDFVTYTQAGEFQYGSSNDLESNKPPQLPTDVVVVSNQKNING